ncbi:MAG: 5'/3'-nucleotidase SurE [Tissierellia bacterium]|nr:5'/3'-nucleotidase SurE [Tissierellia bacterium]
MNILITNDDGIGAKGIGHLIRTARKFGQVYVVAPKTQQSAVSQGITIHEPLQIDNEDGLFEGVTACYSISGKPADCIKVALEYLRFDIDLVLSGVNDGPNLGTDILYSGTVAAASEAAVFNIPAIAFSTDFDHFELVDKELEKTLDYILDQDLAKKGIIVNVNFPLINYSKSKGIKITKQGRRIFNAKFRHEEGKYWQEGTWAYVKNGHDSDVTAVSQGYISISPLAIDRTNQEIFESWTKKDHPIW